jgi:hypothetical protein
MNLAKTITRARLGALAIMAVSAALPAAALAQSLSGDDIVGKPFALWIFLVPIAGIIALLGCYAAKGSIEKPGRR